MTGPPLVPLSPRRPPWYATPPGTAAILGTIVVLLWISLGSYNRAQKHYQLTHRNNSNIDVFKDWVIEAPDGSIKASFIGTHSQRSLVLHAAHISSLRPRGDTYESLGARQVWQDARCDSRM